MTDLDNMKANTQEITSLRGNSVWELVNKGFLFSCDLRRDVITDEIDDLLSAGKLDLAIVAYFDNEDVVDFFFILDENDKVLDYQYNNDMPADEMSDFLVSTLTSWVDARNKRDMDRNLVGGTSEAVIVDPDLSDKALQAIIDGVARQDKKWALVLVEDVIDEMDNDPISSNTTLNDSAAIQSIKEKYMLITK